jgi:mitochondrial cardiolipin hydrolase
MKHFALLLALVALPVAAQIQFFPGECTSDKLFCAYFAPGDVPVAAVAEHLKSARRSIKIATYNMNVKPYTEILSEKLRQGVQVEFLVDYKLSFESNAVWRALPPQPRLLKYRVPVLRGGNPQMHNKIIIIDDKIAITGSANFTYSGLVGNYENIMSMSEPSMVREFIAEFEELKKVAQITCETMSSGGCGRGEERYPRDFHELITAGKMPASGLVSSSGVCQGLVKGFVFLNEVNTVFNPNVPACFKDAGKYSTLATRLAANEKKSSSKLSDKYQVYFSPEDDVEAVILRELSRTLQNPARSFAYVSVNFITNRKLALKLVELKRKGVRLKVFFDRGRYEDPNFKASLSILEELGFSHGGDDEDMTITIFDNRLAGPYSCNHNKMAVIGDGREVTLLNGSANWSAGAMNKNDENLTVVRDADLAAIYLREILSQLFVYRYGQDAQARGFRRDIDFLAASVPCLKTRLGLERRCSLTHSPKSSAIVSVANVPAGKDERVWAWVPQLNFGKGGAVELFTHETFAGRWITAIPMPPGSRSSFKLFKASAQHDPNLHGLQGVHWEYEGMGNDRSVQAAPMAVDVIQGSYVWGSAF